MTHAQGMHVDINDDDGMYMRMIIAASFFLRIIDYNFHLHKLL